MLTYLDSSALVKLVLAERESAALRAALPPGGAHTSSRLSDVEVTRAARRAGHRDADRAQRVIATLALIPLSDDVLAAARALEPVALRSLDAIHLASALSLGNQLDAVVTYDARMLDAARSLGVRTLAPR